MSWGVVEVLGTAVRSWWWKYSTVVDLAVVIMGGSTGCGSMRWGLVEVLGAAVKEGSERIQWNYGK